ncbi:hypothetical protein CKY04_06500 [Photorhabdus sp. S8-52]|nr:hypothetical protein CKY03_06355 [Photorhabdus sp. S9-53]RAX01668.1 hypothetical protein CKY05_05595 [Photorhabdus sp. S10-54]RAX05083.1 hypothetical protein CKY04_06500 [Photorhabdus sp. S8-52]
MSVGYQVSNFRCSDINQIDYCIGITKCYLVGKQFTQCIELANLNSRTRGKRLNRKTIFF